MFSLVSTSTLDCVSRLLGAGLFPSDVRTTACPARRFHESGLLGFSLERITRMSVWEAASAPKAAGDWGFGGFGGCIRSLSGRRGTQTQTQSKAAHAKAGLNWSRKVMREHMHTTETEREGEADNGNSALRKQTCCQLLAD